jgi:hypothetical protein
MLHRKRIWSVFPAESAEWLAEQLTQYNFCGCNGFQLGKYVFVNDATCPDGGQEYAVLMPAGDNYVQIESLTFSWMTGEEALAIIRRVLTGEFDAMQFGSTIDNCRLQSPSAHGLCPHCA